MRGISCLAEDVLASEVGFCCLELDGEVEIKLSMKQTEHN